MTISEIKTSLRIETVLGYYQLSANKNGMLSCPFHEDRKASMKVYVETNTVYCFAGSCEVESLDVIDFIWKMEKCSKHEAILKAKALLENGNTSIIPVAKKSQKQNSTKKINREKLFKNYQTALRNDWSAQKYCELRGLDVGKLEIGFKLKNTSTKWGRNCLIFPLKNKVGEVVSFYGRSIDGDGHFYETGRNGLYPCYPKVATKCLILCESVIDAGSLMQLNLGCGILALYGTNGLTEEHEKAIEELANLEEIILILDGDEAGRKATETYKKSLSKLCPAVTISWVDLPEGEDVNSMTVSHDNAKALFEDLLSNRKSLLKSKEQKIKEQIRNLDKSHPNNLVYSTPTARYYIKGGIRYGANDFDHMKITLVVENDEGRKSRQKLDLYEDKQVEKVSRIASEKLGLRSDLVELDLQMLCDDLEAYRNELQEQAKQPKVKEKVEVPLGERSACLKFMKGRNLIEKINELIGEAGITGEEMNRILLFVVASSFKMSDTLHALIQGSSGSGKTRLLRVISECMPEEDVKRYTRVTDGSFYNQGEYYFVNKLLCFEDIDGLKEEALLAVRELQSNNILITSTSVKDEYGKINGADKVVRGPMASLSCTTKAEIYEDNISRCFVVAVDESKEQSLKIIDYQNKKSAGVIDGKREKEVRSFLQNCIRLLQPLEVINPYANKVHLPQDAHKIRRLNELYQSFVRQITLLNQYQRKRDQQGRLITEKEDLQLACDILFESIVLKVDELDGSLRQFFEQLKKYVKSKGESYEFSRFEIREVTKVSKTQQHRYMNALISMEYLQQWGFANRGYKYRIAHWDDMSHLKYRIRNALQVQLDSL